MIFSTVLNSFRVDQTCFCRTRSEMRLQSIVHLKSVKKCQPCLKFQQEHFKEKNPTKVYWNTQWLMEAVHAFNLTPNQAWAVMTNIDWVCVMRPVSAILQAHRTLGVCACVSRRTSASAVYRKGLGLLFSWCQFGGSTSSHVLTIAFEFHFS